MKMILEAYLAIVKLCMNVINNVHPGEIGSNMATH